MPAPAALPSIMGRKQVFLSRQKSQIRVFRPICWWMRSSGWHAFGRRPVSMDSALRNVAKVPRGEGMPTIGGRCPPYEVEETGVQLGGSLAGNDSSDVSS